MAEKLGHEKFWEADEKLLGGLNVGQSLHKYITQRVQWPEFCIALR